MKINGGCHCGYIAYEAKADPGAALICNCTDCQTLSGSAFRTVSPTRQGSFKLPVRRTENIRQDRRKRLGQTAIILSELRNANPFDDRRRRP